MMSVLLSIRPSSLKSNSNGASNSSLLNLTCFLFESSCFATSGLAKFSALKFTTSVDGLLLAPRKSWEVRKILSSSRSETGVRTCSALFRFAASSASDNGVAGIVDSCERPLLYEI